MGVPSTETRTARPVPIGLLRVAMLLPFIAFAGAYALDDRFRALMNEGVALLLAEDVAGLRAWGERLGAGAAIATTLLMIVQALAAPIPAIFVTFTNSLLFGPFVGAIHSITSATLAAWLCFILARLYGEPLVARLVSAKARARTDDFLAEHGAAAVLAARLLPFVPFDPISFLAGLSRMRSRTFVWATWLGQIPAGFAYSYLGQEISSPARLVAGFSGVFVVLIVIGVSLRRLLFRRRRSGESRG